MIPPQLPWQSAARQFNGRSLRLTSFRPFSSATGRRTCFRLPASTRHAPRQRVQPLSRVPKGPQFFSQHPLLAGKRAHRQSPSLNSNEGIQVLQSRFPTKTAILLLVLGIAYYYVDISIGENLGDRLFNVFGEPIAYPLHLYGNRDEVDHFIQHHIPDVSAGFKDPQFMERLNEDFGQLVYGWEISEGEAIKNEFPVTHGVRFRSNSPCEDYFSIGISPGPGDQLWNFWSVYDGHAGRHTAVLLHWALIPQVSRALSYLHPSSSSLEIENTIKQTFVRVDDDMMSRAKHAGNWYPAANASAITALTPAFSGSCALLAAFDPATSKLRVACTGDSRAVLGRWDPLEEKYICKPLSVDQTGFNQAEVERITAEHPDEPDIISPESGRLLGIAVTRAFGDHRWKWENDFIKQLQFKFWGPAPRPGSKTPPYMTAEPVVTETDVVRTDANDSRGKSDFMIMASDGLWDHISSEHAVELVQRWLEAKARGNGKIAQDPQLTRSEFSERMQLDAGVVMDVEAGKELDWKATPEYFAIEDENAAVCLARNAMGGTRRGLFLGILSVPDPLRRYAVDDTTILVVFFDKLRKNGADETVKEKRKWWPW